MQCIFIGINYFCLNYIGDFVIKQSINFAQSQFICTIFVDISAIKKLIINMECLPGSTFLKDILNVVYQHCISIRHNFKTLPVDSSH